MELTGHQYSKKRKKHQAFNGMGTASPIFLRVTRIRPPQAIKRWSDLSDPDEDGRSSPHCIESVVLLNTPFLTRLVTHELYYDCLSQESLKSYKSDTLKLMMLLRKL